MEIPYNKDITYFAKTNFRGTDQIFGIKRKDRRQHMYVLGKSGSGKSVMLENMIIQNIRQGEGVCVVDPHGELVEKILASIPRERAQDVIYFNPADTDHNIGFNVLQLDDPRYKHLVASGLMGIFTKIWANAWSSRMEYILNNTILALLDTPDTTLLGIPRMLVDKDYRQYIINNLKDPVVKAFWVHEYEAWRDQFRNEAIAPIQNKVGQFLSSNIVRNVVGQTRSTINIFDIMNTKKIFLVNVSKGRIGEDNSALLGGMIITKLQLSAMERVRIPEAERTDFYLYVDEFQNFVTDSFASILSEARKYRLNLIIAHQYIAQLETQDGSAVKDAVFGNVGTMVIFRVGADDADHLEKEFEPEFVIEDFVNLPNYHIYTKLMVDGVTSRPFSAKTLPPMPVDVSKDTEEYIIETSRKIYTRERTVVEAEIQRWSSTVPGQSRPDGEETAGKFKAICSNCGKEIYVPFEPEAGRPIYCKECLFKIKNGEVQAGAGFKAPREKSDSISYAALADLGIEFKPEARGSAPQRFDRLGRQVNAQGNVMPAPSAAVPPIITRAPSVVPRAPAPGAPRPAQTYGTRPRVTPTDDPALPPQGIIRAERSDAPRPSISAPVSQSMPVSSQPAPSPVSEREVSLPVPRVVKAPISKERKMPDTSGLQSLLKSALAGVIPAHQQSAAIPQNPSRTEPQPKPVVPTMSLSALKNSNPQFVVPSKEAQPERQNMLKDAISKAMGEDQETVAPEQPIQNEKVGITESQAPTIIVINQPTPAPDTSALDALKKTADEEKVKREAAELETEKLRQEKEEEEKIRIEIETQKKKMEEERVAREAFIRDQEIKRKEEEELLRQKTEQAKREQEEKEQARMKEEAENRRLMEEEKKRLEVELAQKEQEYKEKLEHERIEGERKRKEEALALEAKLQQEQESHASKLKQEHDENVARAQEAERLSKEREEESMKTRIPVEPLHVPVAQHVTKEVPEDILKQILE
jgi:CxxC-x17-CxxC domain-containing protein